MKHLAAFAVLALLLTGCTRAPEKASAKDLPAKADAPASAETPAPASGKSSDNAATMTFETGRLVPSEQVPLLEQIDRENVLVVSAAVPSIVRITATMPPDPHAQLFGNDMPFQFHTHPLPSLPAYGSGVIISRNGYIVTNNHVVEDARKIEIELADKRTFTAQLVRGDDHVDVAILKIDADDLPPLPWGDSDKLQVGEQVFAIGNPFNLNDSVSKGIVSAKSRSLGANTYEDFIQTDAAINPGNSGGALVNIHGELVGISAAIASESHYNMGVGFAIPSNLVRYAVEGLVKEGRLVRGYLGVVLPRSIDEGVIGFLKLKSDQGALLVDVQSGSPADKAGLRGYDFITRVDGHKIDSLAGLRLVVAQIPIGKEVPVSFIRDGAPQTTTIKIAEMPAEPEFGAAASEGGDEPNNFPMPGPLAPEAGNVLEGLSVSDLNDGTRRKFGVNPTIKTGVVVTDVRNGSTAEDKGLARGDVIESVNVDHGTMQPVGASKIFSGLTKGLKPDQGVVLLVEHRDKSSSFVFLAPEK
jgi:serine protease Do